MWCYPKWFILHYYMSCDICLSQSMQINVWWHEQRIKPCYLHGVLESWLFTLQRLEGRRAIGRGGEVGSFMHAKIHVCPKSDLAHALCRCTNTTKHTHTRKHTSSSQAAVLHDLTNRHDAIYKWAFCSEKASGYYKCSLVKLNRCNCLVCT